tara:strand:- start:2238 stop:3488 length:1251 start_codon:yes stop_codon:yes gene_type:complete
MGLGQRANKFNELGRIQSIKPASDPPLTEVEAYTITSIGQPASVIHARDPILQPGSETELNVAATFFEPTESYGSDGVPQFAQYVINKAIGNVSEKVSEYNEYFTVTNPGVMSTSGAYATAANGGTATMRPRAESEPSTFRKEGVVQVFLTTSSDADPEVAYSDENTNWCAIAFDNFFFNLSAETASVSTSYRTFRKYLNSAGTTNSAFAQSTGQYSASANSFGTGDTTYNVNGLYRSKVVPFFKRNDGTQCYLKTNVTFSGASVSASSSDNGSISAELNGSPVADPQGFTSYAEGVDDPIYKATPDSGKFLVSLKVNGQAQSISDPTTFLTHTFTDVTGSNSFEATFGHSVTINASGPVSVVSPSGVQYVANGGSVDIVFNQEPSTLTFNGVSQTISGSSYTVSNIIENVVVSAG